MKPTKYEFANPANGNYVVMAMRYNGHEGDLTTVLEWADKERPGAARLFEVVTTRDSPSDGLRIALMMGHIEVLKGNWIVQRPRDVWVIMSNETFRTIYKKVPGLLPPPGVVTANKATKAYIERMAVGGWIPAPDGYVDPDDEAEFNEAMGRFTRSIVDGIISAGEQMAKELGYKPVILGG